MTLHFVVPDAIDDPRRPSGGNVYGRRLATGLAAAGLQVREHRVGRAGLGSVLAGLPDGALVLVDGLVASTTAALVPESRRLRTAVLLHMPGSGPAEVEVLTAVHAVVTTSHWARSWVIDRTPVPPQRVHVAVPGVDPGPLVTGSPDGRNLLCVGPVTPAKGYGDLVAALAEVGDLDWRCRCVGPLDLAPAFVTELRDRLARLGLSERLELLGPLSPASLDALRSESDLVVAPSLRESWGMALAEGLARGLPAVATAVGGHAEALGSVDGELPGALVPANEPAVLAGALRGWWGDAEQRARWRAAAAGRRRTLATWPTTVRRVIAVLNLIEPGTVHSDRG